MFWAAVFRFYKKFDLLLVWLSDSRRWWWISGWFVSHMLQIFLQHYGKKKDLNGYSKVAKWLRFSLKPFSELAINCMVQHGNASQVTNPLFCSSTVLFHRCKFGPSRFHFLPFSVRFPVSLLVIFFLFYFLSFFSFWCCRFSFSCSVSPFSLVSPPVWVTGRQTQTRPKIETFT